MSIMQIKAFASAILVISVLITACSKHADSQTVAQQFVRFYFVEDSLAEAVNLASGSARTRLEESLQEIEAMDAAEPDADKPTVKVALMETQSVAQDEMLYVFRITPDVEVGGMEPVTARLWLSKEGGTWYVSRFVQEE